MKVAILCGGRGTRFREVSDVIPKPMAPIGNRPILWHIMKIYSSYGFNDFVLLLGYKGDYIRNFFLNFAALTNDITIDMGKYDVGVVKQEDGTYSLEADWWGVETTKGLKEEEVVKELNAKYAYQRVVAAVEEQGYTIDQNAVQKDGTVKLTVSKWE